MFNPYAKQIKFVQVVNASIHSHKKPFFMYRTKNGQVEQIAIDLMEVDLSNGNLKIHYGSLLDETAETEQATASDLKLITQQAQTYQQQALAKQTAKR